MMKETILKTKSTNLKMNQQANKNQTRKAHFKRNLKSISMNLNIVFPGSVAITQ